MSETTFENAEIGDRVWDSEYGWGTIVDTVFDRMYSIGVKFDNGPGVLHYSTKGTIEPNGKQWLFWDEVKLPTRNAVTKEKLDVPPKSEEIPESSLDKQVGGSHYKNMQIQPLEFTHKNNLNFCQGNIVKYACRYKNKNGVEDLKKVKHYAELLAKLEYGEDI